MDDMPRYSIITGKNPREICLLRGRGCQWRRCAFCDYHLDFSRNQEENFDLNRQVLAQVDGHLGRLEIINSGSFCDLCQQTHQEIRRICSEKKIREAVMGELKNVFRPEFLNRVDDIIVFHQLGKEDISPRQRKVDRLRRVLHLLCSRGDRSRRRGRDHWHFRILRLYKA